MTSEVRRQGRRAATCALALAIGACAKPNAAIPTGAAAYQVIPPTAPAGTTREYRIGAGDTLNVTVFQEPDLSVRELAVDASGDIALPLVGTVRATGLTAGELSRTLAARLDAFLIRPQVSVSVATAVSQKVTVDGSVEQPGIYPIQGRTTLIDALALARGTTRVAALDEVVVFREIDGRMAAARFNVGEIRAGRQPNPEILGRDLVVVGFSNLKGFYRDAIASAGLLGSFTYLIAR